LAKYRFKLSHCKTFHQFSVFVIIDKIVLQKGSAVLLLGIDRNLSEIGLFFSYVQNVFHIRTWIGMQIPFHKEQYLH
jgi:hypothetical protein